MMVKGAHGEPPLTVYHLPSLLELFFVEDAQLSLNDVEDLIGPHDSMDLVHLAHLDDEVFPSSFEFLDR